MPYESIERRHRTPAELPNCSQLWGLNTSTPLSQPIHGFVRVREGFNQLLEGLDDGVTYMMGPGWS